MARVAAGTIFEKPVGSGRYYARFTTVHGRKTIRLLTCATHEAANSRREFIAKELERLRQGGQEAHADKLLELAAVADGPRLVRIRKGVDAILAGETRPTEPRTPLTQTGPTFREFAEEWTGGKLHLRFPDHVKRKKTAQEDVYRLQAHVYPSIGDLPLALVTLEDAERVMRGLNEALSVGSRRQVAQLLHRVLALAAYPARLIEVSPIPEGFLPKPGAPKAQAWLYPDEEARLLACRDVPLLYRLLYGFLAREGMRRDEALSLTWSDLDLNHGTVTLAENKTDDPRAWVLGLDVVRALRQWRTYRSLAADQDQSVFVCGTQTVDGAHLAASLRVHLAKTGGARIELFQRTDRRAPIRAHDLRATFVTLALASNKSETWVCDRTGHRSSQMLNRYRRPARRAAELCLGWLAPLDTAIPELMQISTGDSVVPDTTEIVQDLSTAVSGDGQSIDVPSARVRLVTALTDAAKELILLGDSATARIAIAALAELAREDASGSTEPPLEAAAPAGAVPRTLRQAR